MISQDSESPCCLLWVLILAAFLVPSLSIRGWPGDHDLETWKAIDPCFSSLLRKGRKAQKAQKSCLLLSPKGGGESKDRSRAFPKNLLLSFAPRQCRILLPNLPLRSRRRFTAQSPTYQRIRLEANKIESTAIAATKMRTRSWKQEIDTSDGMAKECNRFLQCWTGARHGYTIWSKVLSEMFKVYTIEIKTPIWAITPSATHTYKEWRRNMNGQWA